MPTAVGVFPYGGGRVPTRRNGDRPLRRAALAIMPIEMRVTDTTLVRRTRLDPASRASPNIASLSSPRDIHAFACGFTGE
jgi:hypothetical protein